MVLIKKEPVGQISVTKEGNIKIEHYSDGKKKPCIYCGTLTKKRIFGSPECEECIEYDYKKCSKCEFGFKEQTFHCNGNDSEDHFTSYIACAMRDYYGKLRDKPDFEETPSSWSISPLERKKCFKKKITSEPIKKIRKFRIQKQRIDDWIYRHIPRFLFQEHLNKKFKKLRLQFEKNYELKKGVNNWQYLEK